MKRPHAERSPIARARAGRSGAARLAIFGGVLTLLLVNTSDASFTDAAVVGIGATGSVGGSYDIALLDGTGTVQQGEPTPLTLDTTGVAKVKVGAVADSATASTRVVTTTPATGPIVLRLYNAYSGTRPADPGYSGAGADPYDVARFTIVIDGTTVATSVTASAFNVAGMTITGWVTGTPKTIQVTATLGKNLGNPYYFNRAMVLGLQFDGSTS